MNDSNAETITTTWKVLHKVAGAVVLIVFILFLMGIIGLIGDLQPDTISGWIANNWLVKLFKMNAGINGESIYVFNLLDILIMVLFGIMSLALYPALRKVSKIWSIVAISEPFLGIVIFIITHSAGRSGVLAVVLTISIIMLWSNNFSKITAYMGILAGGLLLTGDILSTSSLFIIAIIIAIGYILIMIWCILIALKLFQISKIGYQENKELPQ